MPERIGREPHRVEPVMPIPPHRPLGKEEPQPPKPDVTAADTPSSVSPTDELTDDPEHHIISTRR